MSEKLKTFVNMGVKSDDLDEVRIKKSIMTIATTCIAVLAIIWGSIYSALDLAVASAIPLGYAAISLSSMLYFFRTKNFIFFNSSQLLL
ncbi:MAG: GGDEF domain-containing protein, partial [Thiohalomonadales bacterium]